MLISSNTNGASNQNNGQRSPRQYNHIKILPEEKEFAQLSGVGGLIESFISNWQDELSVDEHTYLKRGLKQNWNGMTRPYMMMNMYTNPYAFQPSLANYGAVLYMQSCWLKKMCAAHEKISRLAVS